MEDDVGKSERDQIVKRAERAWDFWMKTPAREFPPQVPSDEFDALRNAFRDLLELYDKDTNPPPHDGTMLQLGDLRVTFRVTELPEFQALLQDLKLQRDNLKAAFEGEKQYRDQDVARLTRERDNFAQAVKELQKELVTRTTERDGARVLVDQQNRRLQWDPARPKASDRIAALEQNLAWMTAARDALAKKVDSLTEELRLSNNTAVACSNLATKRERQLDDAEKSIREKLADIDRLVREKRELEDRVEQYREQIRNHSER